MSLIHWEALATRANWRDYVLPGRTDEQFWADSPQEYILVAEK